jgi:hypothetical protein
MRLIFLLIGFALLAIGIALLVGPLLEFPSIPPQITSAPPTAAAAVIALAGLMFTLRQQLADKADARSRFYLEEYRKGYDSAYAVLDGADAADPILRLKWIAASRILEAARRLSAKITVTAHRDVMNMDIPRQAERFQKFLRHPAAYYYGVVPPAPAMYGEDYLNEAARRSTKEIDGIMNAHTEVEEKVIFTVWKAIQYPPEYADVLGDTFNDGQVMFLPPPLKTYVEHVRGFQSAHGKLYPRRGGDEILPLYLPDNFAESVNADLRTPRNGPV